MSFSRLSTEIRFMVYRLAFPRGREVSVFGKVTQSPNATLPHTVSPSTLAICRESRLETLHHYFFLPRLTNIPHNANLPHEYAHPGIYINPALDSIWTSPEQLILYAGHNIPPAFSLIHTLEIRDPSAKLLDQYTLSACTFGLLDFGGLTFLRILVTGFAFQEWELAVQEMTWGLREFLSNWEVVSGRSVVDLRVTII